jgi:translation initiation factor 2-alpha kinase 4
MERHLVITDFKQKGDIPVSWATQFPGQSILLRRSLCPSAVDLLQNELLHRMEDEWLNGKFLTSMHCCYDDCYYYLLIVETEGCTILLIPFVGLSVLCLYVLLSVHYFVV